MDNKLVIREEKRDLQIVYEEIKQEIACCEDIPKLKNIKNNLKAWEVYYKSSGASEEIQNLAGELLTLTERRMGIILPEMIQHGGNKLSTYPDVSLTTLEELGISSKQSSRYQQLARIPEEEFTKFLNQLKEENRKRTKSAIIGLLKERESEERIKREEEDRKKRIGDIEIKTGDFKEVLKDVYNIDAIITDPPYPQEFIGCFSELSLFAKEHLKKDGFIAVYSGQYHLPEVIKRLSEHLTYVWTFCLYHLGKKELVNGVNIMCGWKPVLIFSNGKKKMRYSAYDVLVSEQREKFGHEWQQSESGVYSLIDILTKPGELIVDPFAGTGTFLKVAYENGRKVIGAEMK